MGVWTTLFQFLISNVAYQKPLEELDRCPDWQQADSFSMPQ